ncbi:type III pantothenate kinase [Aliidiomarina sp. B3213]|uniref:type III pantothenate kinase n=1 Tax=Aliidiomarina sp. B3213 TaxID=2249757 RepID=UPI001402160F|nr:type III pantothenate kinase [Aliidiomarina sp. B3213]
MLEHRTDVVLVEAGNTSWKVATCTGADELQLQLRTSNIVELRDWLSGQTIKTVVLASVGAEQEAVTLISELQDLGFEVYRVQTGEIDGFSHCYKDISHLGVDRWLTMVAVKDVGKPSLIIDIGTAFTADWLSATGEHLGGWIAPGFALMQESLVRRSARLRVQDAVPEGIIGQGTESAIATGCAAALDGLVNYAIEYADETFATKEYDIYLTGGGVRHLKQERSRNFLVRPHLVLEGLAIWVNENL